MSPAPSRGQGFTVGTLDNLRDDLVADYHFKHLQNGLEAQQAQAAQMSPSPQEQDEGVNWLNVAGLGALTAALGAGAYALARGRRPPGRVAPGSEPPAAAASRPPAPPSGPPSRPAPGPTAQRRSVPPQDADPRNDPSVLRALQLFENDPAVNQALDSGATRAEVFVDPQTGRQVFQLIGTVPASEAANQARLGRTVPQNRASRAQYLNELRAAAGSILESERGINTNGTVNLNPVAAAINQAVNEGLGDPWGPGTPSSHVTAMNTGAYQQTRRFSSPGKAQQETPRGGAEVLNNIMASLNRQNQFEDARARAQQRSSRVIVDPVSVLAQELNEGLIEDTSNIASPGRVVNPAILKQLESAQEQAQNFASQKVSDIALENMTKQERIQERRDQRVRPQKGGIYEGLIKAGVPEFEVIARTQAYANSTEPLEVRARFLDPSFNAKTVGEKEFADALGIVNPRLNRRGEIVKGQLLNPEGDVRRSLAYATKPLIETKDGDTYDPVAEQLGSVEGSVSVTPALGETKGRGVSALSDEEYKKLKATKLVQQQVLGEQYKKAIDDFGSIWDQRHNEFVSGSNPNSSIQVPRIEGRKIDLDDLNTITRVEYGDDGELLSSAFYRDQLSPEIVDRVTRGEEVYIPDVPFIVNKERALQQAELYGDQMPELKVKAAAYQNTGRELARIYGQIVKPIESAKTVQRDLGIVLDYDPEMRLVEQQFKSGAFFDPGETGITPAYGEGSQKGRLVGGVPEVITSSSPVYDLFYKDHTTTDGRLIKIVKALAVGPDGVPSIEQNVLLKHLDLTRQDGTPLYRRDVIDTDDLVATQPMLVTRILPRDQTLEVSANARRARRKGIISEDEAAGINTFTKPYAVGAVEKTNKKTGKTFHSPVYEAVDEEVSAPLQIIDLDSNLESRATALPRKQLIDLISEAQRNVTSQRGELKGNANRIQNEISGLYDKEILSDAEVEGINNFVAMVNAAQGPKYKQVAGETQRLLGEQLRVNLPVLESPTAYQFIENLTGKPRSVPTRRRLVSLGRADEVYPISDEDLARAQALGLLPKTYGSTSQNDYSLTRGVLGPVPENVTTSAKPNSGRASEERVGWEASDVVSLNDYEDTGRPSAYYPSVELGRSRSPQQMKKDASLTGPRALIYAIPSFIKDSSEIGAGQNLPVNRNRQNIFANDLGQTSNTVNLTDVNAVLSQLNPSNAAQPSRQPVNVVSVDPMKLLMRRFSDADAQRIQNPPGRLGALARQVDQQRKSTLADLQRAALLTPGGRMVLGQKPMAIGPAPGDMVADVSKGGRIVGKEVIASRPAGSQLAPALISTGPNNMSASQTIETYGAAPNQIAQYANQLMYQAAQQKTKDSQNKQALAQYRAPQQLELLDTIPATREFNPQFKVTPKQQAYLKALEAGEARRRLFAEGQPSLGQLSLDLG